MSTPCNIKHPLNRDGTNQVQRLLDSLDPDFIQIDERRFRDLLSFAEQYAGLIRYYDETNLEQGTWKEFFSWPNFAPNGIKALTEGEWQKLFQTFTAGDTPPHLTLFLAFLDIFRYASDHLNTLTQRHLDFYFREILHLKEGPAQPDKVHLLLTLADAVQHHKISKGTAFDGGKDASGRRLTYQSDRDQIINQARLSRISTLFVEYFDEYGEHVYVAPQANSGDGLGGDFQEENPNWSIFGQPQSILEPENRTMVESEMGLALASPMLWLAEGNRKIDLSFHLQFEEEPKNLTLQPPWSHLFKISLTGAKGWLETPCACNFSLTPSSGPFPWQAELKFTITLDPEKEAVLAYQSKIHGLNLETDQPVLRIVWNKDQQFLPIRILSAGKVDQADLEVTVNGIKDLVLRNDQASFQPGRAFAPYSSQPTLQNRFYVGNLEAMRKPLQELNLNLNWKNLPANLTDHYAAYESVQEQDFKVKSELLWAGKWNFLEENRPLFTNGNLISSTFNYPSGYYDFPDPGLLDDQPAYGMLRLELTGPNKPGLQAFGHQEYPLLYTRQLMLLNHHTFNQLTGPEPLIPAQPYTPEIKELSLDYRSKIALNLAGSGAQKTSGRLFHLHPFGTEEMGQARPDQPFTLFPQVPDEANLFLGIENLNPRQTVSLLFQLLQGSGNNFLDLSEVNLNWSYLSKNGWRKLEKGFRFHDSTEGLLQEGILELSLPGDASESHSLMPAGLKWVRLGVNKHSAAFPRAAGIHAQAVLATFSDQGNDPAHLNLPLPAESVKKLLPSQPEVRSLSQPYASFDGQAVEQGLDFYIRVSERLRHKQRAITVWDYERMVLEQFPEIWKVKCIPHSDNYSEGAPGNVAVIVVPNLRNRNAVDPLRPSVGQATLRRIHTWLSRHIPSLFVDLTVENPDFEDIRLEFKVGFHPGFDAGFYGNELNEALKRFLSPWAYEEGQDIAFGGKIHKSKIIKFIEDQPYVDFVIDFVVYHNTTGSRFAGVNFMQIECDFIVHAPDVEIVQATSERSVLISANQHHITVLEPGQHDCACDCPETITN
ncbi:MAG: hypothetical protein H6581_24990 [Bacteroidia bacterium]|nr:hypothetical protein [Bacteroidia bacterium]